MVRSNYLPYLPHWTSALRLPGGYSVRILDFRPLKRSESLRCSPAYALPDVSHAVDGGRIAPGIFGFSLLGYVACACNVKPNSSRIWPLKSRIAT